jgi:hypothetical protein
MTCREHELLQHLVASKDVLLVEKCLADIAALELRHKVMFRVWVWGLEIWGQDRMAYIAALELRRAVTHRICLPELHQPCTRSPKSRILQVQRADAQLGLLKSRSLSPSGRDRPFSPSTSSLLASPTPPIQTSPSPPPVRGSGSEEPAPEPMGGSEEPAPEPMAENH